MDEFLVTSSDKKVVDVIDELVQQYNNTHFYINSFDINDRFDLDQDWYTLQEYAKLRWDYDEMRTHPSWNTRG